jgi:iron(III) transport system permease protein
LQLHGVRRVLAWGLCSLPVLLGFVLPVLIMLRAFVGETTEMPWERFGQWAWTSLRWAPVTAVLAVGVALALVFQCAHPRPTASAGGHSAGGLGLCHSRRGGGGGLAACRWAGFSKPGPHRRQGLGSRPRRWALVWAYLVRFCAVALQSVQSGYARIPASLDDSARMLGVTGWGLMRRVHAPLLQRTTMAAALLVFVDVMKELPATMVLRPFNSDTLAVVAYQLARDERLGEAALPGARWPLVLVSHGLIPVMSLLSRTR